MSKVILFGERSLRRVLSEYVEHFHAERNHQGRATSCCSLGVRTSGATGLFNAASDWATLALLPSGGSVNGGGASDEFFDLMSSPQAPATRNKPRAVLHLFLIRIRNSLPPLTFPIYASCKTQEVKNSGNRDERT